ncbi:hypothetical protein LZ32DRAFT_644259 [Colletotrichum eremochloae]|nr:hypothetical protein LZ32DRAFT_644259 [Colletotrichum eremochloae]
MAKVSQGKRRKTLKGNRNHDVETLTRRVRGLYDVPLEILLIIANELPTNFRTALALACKGFFKSICPDGRFPRMQRAEAIELVLLLERDAIAQGHTDLFLCFGCARLQRFKRNDDGSGSTLHNPACDFVVRFIKSYNEYPVRSHPGYPLPPGYTIPPDYNDGLFHIHRWIELVSTVIWKPAVRGLGGNEPAITFAEARLIMDKHLFGDARGISIERFEKSFHFSRVIPYQDTNGLFMSGSYPLESHFPLEQHISKMRYHLRPRNATVWSFEHTTSAKVINNELFIHRHHAILGPPCDLGLFVKVIDSLELPVCRHILGCSYAQRMGSSASACIPELHTLRVVPAHSKWDIHPDQGIRSCQFCATDYEISIQRGSNQQNWGVKLTTYHKLGQCRTPDDPTWKNLVGFLSASDNRYVTDVPGTVRQAWLKHHGQMDRAPANLRIEWASRTLGALG